jgi:hypothetical protein
MSSRRPRDSDNTNVSQALTSESSTLPESTPRTEYQQKRLEKIAKNHELLRGLQTDVRLSGLVLTENRPKPTVARKTARKREAKEPIQPVRTSARLRGLQADGAVAVKREAEEAAGNADGGNKRMRVAGDLNVTDIITSGAWDKNGRLLEGLNGRGYELQFDPQSAKETSDAELRTLIENFGDLGLWQNVEPNSTCDSVPKCPADHFRNQGDSGTSGKAGNFGIAGLLTRLVLHGVSPHT